MPWAYAQDALFVVVPHYPTELMLRPIMRDVAFDVALDVGSSGFVRRVLVNLADSRDAAESIYFTGILKDSFGRWVFRPGVARSIKLRVTFRTIESDGTEEGYISIVNGSQIEVVATVQKRP